VEFDFGAQRLFFFNNFLASLPASILLLIIDCEQEDYILVIVLPAKLDRGDVNCIIHDACNQFDGGLFHVRLIKVAACGSDACPDMQSTTHFLFLSRYSTLLTQLIKRRIFK
jgi:hypothetical protein